MALVFAAFGNSAVAKSDDTASPPKQEQSPDSASPFLRPEQHAEAKAANASCDTAFPSRLPVRCWAGQKLIVLPMDRDLRTYGYVHFKGGSGQMGIPTYDELAGKIVTVTNVAWVENQDEPALSDWHITFSDDATGKIYATWHVMQAAQKRESISGRTRVAKLAGASVQQPDDATVANVALLRDLKAARDKYLDRTYWITSRWLPELSENGGMSFTNVVVFRKYTPVKISDILASWSTDAPVRIVIKNEAGQEGYFDMAVSQSNRTTPPSGDIGDAALATILASSDPRLGHNWPARIWNAIETGTALLGMTPDQARMSWGSPTKTKTSVELKHAGEIWDYPDHRSLHFKDGSLVEIEK
jgi:hypothetical protein